MKTFRKANKNNKRNRKPGGGRYTLARLPTYSDMESARINLVDPHKFLVLKYSDVFTQSLATVTATNQIMNMNSLFDPDRTGTGHQPYGHDQIAALYNRYRVWSLQWKITFHAESQGFHVVVTPTNGNLATAITNVTSFAAACETPRANVHSQGTGANSVVLRGNLQLNELNGSSPTEYKSDDRFQAVFGSSPGELLLLNIGTYNSSGSTVAIDFIVELWYHVEVYDPIILAQS